MYVRLRAANAGGILQQIYLYRSQRWSSEMDSSGNEVTPVRIMVHGQCNSISRQTCKAAAMHDRSATLDEVTKKARTYARKRHAVELAVWQGCANRWFDASTLNAKLNNSSRVQPNATDTDGHKNGRHVAWLNCGRGGWWSA